ncbi:MAG: glycosyltransferase [Hyphomicrobiaceae bacterium]
MLVSVVIPTNGRRLLLAAAIESCRAQRLPDDTEFEVLVVDNTRDGAARGMVEGYGDPRLRWISEPRPGVSEARNAGVRNARGTHIAFLDDDEVAPEHWLAALLAVARRGAVAVFGPVEPLFETMPDAALLQIATRLYSRRIEAADGADITAFSARLGTGNSLFEKSVCFPGEAPFATELSGLGGEDTLFLRDLIGRGVRLTWAASAGVAEHVPADRVSTGALATRLFRNGQVRTYLRMRRAGWGWIEGLAWMGIGAAQLAGYGAAGLLMSPFKPDTAAALRLKAQSGAGKLAWMRPFWKISYGTASSDVQTARWDVTTATGAPDAPVVSIIVISYRTREMTLECLRSIVRETREASYEILVVDNASDDGSAAAIAAEFPQVRLYARTDNIGFAAANNVAAEHARGRYLLLLNPDTVVLDGAIDKLIQFARERPQAGIWGGRTLYGDHSLNPTSCWRRMSLWTVFCRTTGLTGLFPASQFFNPESYGRWDRSTVREVDIVTGCFLLIERALWERLGGFDTRFFMYGEEADLCMRAKKLSARPTVTPDATIIHYGGASERVRSEMMVRLLAAKAEIIKRHWSTATRKLGLTLLATWPWTRATALSAAAKLLRRPNLAEQAETWRTIWNARERWRHGYE